VPENPIHAVKDQALQLLDAVGISRADLTQMDPRKLSLYDYADQMAHKYGLDAGVFRNLVSAESSWDASAKSAVGALGLTQLLPATAAEMGVADPMDPLQNLEGGAKYLRHLLDYPDIAGSYERAIAAYHGGIGNMRRFNWQIPEDWVKTRAYVDTVLAGYKASAEQPDERDFGDFPAAFSRSEPKQKATAKSKRSPSELGMSIIDFADFTRDTPQQRPGTGPPESVPGDLSGAVINLTPAERMRLERQGIR
jgi:hypothetical protein